MRACGRLAVVLSCFVGAAACAADVARDGFTVSLDVDLSRVTTNEALYSHGALDVCLRQSSKDKALRDYDVRYGNYVNFPLPDGSCPIVEATVCPKGGRVGIPLSLFVQTGGTHRVTLHYDTVHFRIFAGDQTDDEMPTTMVCPVVWPSNAVERILSPRVKRADFVTPAKPGVVPKEPDVRPIAGSPQFWTPPAFNAWVGDVAVGVWKGRFHVFYLYDRRHHGSGGGTGRHYFAHLSSADLVHWEEHPLVTPIEQWWECVGTGTPFEYEGKFCLAYGLHTSRVAERKDLVYAHRDELPKEKRGDGEFTFADLPNAIPAGGTYAETGDGIRFRKTGVYVTSDQNPTVYNRADGRLGLATENGQLFYSTDGKIGHWAADGEPAPAGGDCPAPFSWGDRDYLLQGFYWMASRGLDGKWENWTESGDDIYDGVSVPMVATWKDGRRILVGWLGHTMGWGGWLVFRELVRFPDGKLGTKWLKETPPPGEVRTFHVTDVTKPFVLRTPGDGGVELRIDPSEARAQFAFPSRGKESKRMQTAAEILAARPPEKRFAKRNQEGSFAWKGGAYAIGKIRGLDKPFTVRVAQHYDAKSDVTVFDVEIAGTRTMLARRSGRVALLRPESPALKLGFQPLPYDQMGLRRSRYRPTLPIREAEGAREHPEWIGEPADMTVGVVSDIHIEKRDDAQHRRFLKALRYFRSRGVRAVVVSGDLANSGYFDELACVRDAWNEVFPGGLGADGKKVERIFIYGNHDVAKWGGKVAKHIAEAWPTPELKRENAICYDPAYAWERAFDEVWSPVYLKRVGGRVFVGVHWGHEREAVDFLEKNRALLSDGRPFFFVLHPHPSGTCHGFAVRQTTPQALVEKLSTFPNAVALSGHSHYPVTDEKALWRGAFTSVGLGSLYYTCAPAFRHMPNGYENTKAYSPQGKGADIDRLAEGNKMTPMIRHGGTHGVVLQVRKNRLVFERYDFSSDVPERVAADWVVPTSGAGAGAQPFEARARLEKAPAFRPGATLEVRPVRAKTHGFTQYDGWPIEPPVAAGEKDGLSVLIPPADAVDGSRTFEYEIVVDSRTKGVCGRCYALTEDYARAMSKPADRKVQPVSLAFEQLPAGEIRFRVTPVTSLGTRGRELVSEWVCNGRDAR